MAIHTQNVCIKGERARDRNGKSSLCSSQKGGGLLSESSLVPEVNNDRQYILNYYGTIWGTSTQQARNIRMVWLPIKGFSF